MRNSACLLGQRAAEPRKCLGEAIVLAEAAVKSGAGLELAAFRLKKAQAAADQVVADASMPESSGLRGY